MEKAKRFFESARTCKEGGSLTILATIETETRLHQSDSLFKQLQGVSDIQIALDRKVFQEGIFPAVNIHLCANRTGERLVCQEDWARIYILRRVLSPLSAAERIKLLGSKLLSSPSNSRFLSNMSSI